jgi:hypothetical protein
MKATPSYLLLFGDVFMNHLKTVFAAIKGFLKDLLYGPDGRPSCTTAMAAAAFALFVLVTLFLVFAGRAWEHYPVFAGLTCGGGLSAQVGGKFINARRGEQ